MSESSSSEFPTQSSISVGSSVASRSLWAAVRPPVNLALGGVVAGVADGRPDVDVAAPVGPAGITGRVGPADALPPGLSEPATVSAITGTATAIRTAATIPMISPVRLGVGCPGGPPAGYGPGWYGSAGYGPAG